VETRFEQLLKQKGCCLYPWILPLEDEDFICLYDLLNTSFKCFRKKSHTVDDIINALKHDELIHTECRYHVDKFIPLSPIAFAFDTSLISIGRIDIVVPLGIEERFAKIPFICETPFIDNVTVNDVVNTYDEIEKYLQQIKTFVEDSDIYYLVLNLGLVGSNHRAFRKLLQYIATVNSKFKVLNISYLDFLSYKKEVLSLFDVINVTLTDDDVCREYEDVIRGMNTHFSKAKINYVIVETFRCPSTDNFVKAIASKDVPMLIVPAGGGSNTDISRYFATDRFFRVPSLSNIQYLYYTNFAPCRYGSIAIVVSRNGMKICSACTHYCYGGYVDELDVDLLAEAVRGWRDLEECSRCAFRYACFFCRYAVEDINMCPRYYQPR